MNRGPEMFAFGFSTAAALASGLLFGAGFGFAAACAGALFAADVALLRIIVSAFTGAGGSGKISGVRAAFLFFVKVSVLALVVVFLILFARLDILGFTTGLTAGVAGVITAGLVSRNGAL